ncbi:hypothetical protein [Clostridium sp. BL-8]|uniref:hypothetical protein n=1 Tax=Clostridium sp. BL-8 TaxID=349938 RepID=UPI00098C74EE|nr:hypothetical protein [Clostridium sp. BL-8]OOM79521.1 hypothetical protein CLOBL_15480 [Clostridium sp. BL-8]
MESFKTKYGEITGIVKHNLYENGTLRDCTIGKANILKTKYGELIPQYDYVDIRRKYIKSISFFEDGTLQRISLNTQTRISTSLGPIYAELITFYPNENINRIFPLNGQLSAYWDEDQEFALSKKIPLTFPFGDLEVISTGIYFYDNGNVKGISLWPEERLEINTPIGKQSVRLGFSLYENGDIKAFEPSSPLSVPTPIGNIVAFDSNNYTFFKEMKSVNFTETGSLECILTSKNKIQVIDSTIKKTHFFEPKYYDDLGNGEYYIYPLKIAFKDDFVYFDDINKFSINECTFSIGDFNLPDAPKCTSDCSTCMSSCSSGSISII